MPQQLKQPPVLTSIDGRLVPKKEAVISVFDNALLYAQGLFETFLAVDDRIVFGADHLKRLYAGARVLDLPIPVSAAKLQNWIRQLLRNHPARIKKLRLTITAGESSRWLGTSGPPRVILSAAAHALPTNPFSLYVSSFRVDHRSVMRRIKTISYAIQATALKEARKNNCDDALLLNERNQIAEITSANIFWVKRGVVYTPGLDDGCLDGVTRRQVLKMCHRLALPVCEKSQSLSAMLRADELFLSSSLKLVLPISSVRSETSQANFEIGPVARMIGAAMHRAARVA